MKLVFCGNIMDYEQFISKLVNKGKDVRDYRYIRDREYVLGMNSDNILVQLSSYINHPNHPAISAELEHRGIKSASARDRSPSPRYSGMFQSGGIVEPRLGTMNINQTFRDGYVDSVSNLVPQQITIPQSYQSVYYDEVVSGTWDESTWTTRNTVTWTGDD